MKTFVGLDKPSVDKINQLHPDIIDITMESFAQAFARLTGSASLRITQGLRTFAEQQSIYDQGRTKPGKVVTNAKPGSSFHNYGLAVDFCLILNDKEISWDTVKDFDGDGLSDWMEVVDSFKKNGFKWGGDFKSIKDYPHFEMTFGYGWRELLDKYNKKEFIPGTAFVKL